jgi:DNA polymerase-3 subunit delta
MVRVLTGTNWFGVKARLDELTGTFVKEHGDLALERLDANEASYEQIVGAIESLPFLASKKLVIVQELSANKQAAESFEALLERLPDITDLIIVESKVDKRSVYYKTLKKSTEFEEFNQLDEYQIAEWLVSQASNQQAELSKNDARYLVERAGNDQTKLAGELDKLIAFSPKISRSNIDLLVDSSPSSTIFNLIDSMFSGDLSSAISLYKEQRSQRIEPQAIHAMLVWQMHTVALVSAAPKEDSAQKIAASSGMNPFVVQKSQRIAGKMDRTKIMEFIGLLRDIDYRSKRETLDYDEALKFALVSLTR